MATAGSILIDLLAKTASFVTDMGRAEKATRNFKKEALDFKAVLGGTFLGSSFSSAATELVRSLAQVPGALNDIVKEAGNLQDLADRIGANAEEFAGFSIAAATAETSMESIADMSTKLTKALSKVDDESKGAGAALSALNIPLDEFKRLDPVQQIERLSKALAGFESGTEQTAVLEALVRGGSQFLPFLKELEAQGGRQNILTKEQIALADQFSDSQARSAAQLKAFVQQAVIPALPALTALTTSVKDVSKALLGFDDVTQQFKQDNPLVSFAEDAGRALAEALDFFRNSAKEFNAIIGAIKSIRIATQQATGALPGSATQTLVDAFTPTQQKAGEEAAKTFLQAYEETLRKQKLNLTGVRFNASTDPRSTTFGQPLKPRIDISGLAADGGADDPAKKLLDNQVKALEAIIRREQDLLGERNRFLNLFNEQGLVSIRDYYDAQIAIVESATTAQIAAIDKQIALTQAARAKATKDTDRADLTGKLDDLATKRAKTEQDATSKAIELAIRREQAEKRFGQQIETTRASVLELQGGLSAAAEIRFDVQNQELIARAAAEGNTQLQALLVTLRQAAVEQAKFAEGADLRGINAQLLELRGNLGAAAAIRFDEQNFSLIQRLTAQGNTQALELVKTLRQATIAQAEFGRAAGDTQRVIDALAISEDRIAISRQLGATTELGALQQLGAERQRSLAQLEAMVQAQEAIARASGNPALEQQAARARVELERLAAAADPLGDKFRSIFADAGATGIETLLNDISKGKDALKAFGDEVTRQINRIIAQNASEAIFGRQGLLGGLVGSFGGLFGGGSGAADAGAGSAAKAAADTSAAAATTALAASATAAAAALTQLSAGTAVSGGSSSAGTGGFWSGLLDWFGSFFAQGGSPPVGKVSVGGERGRELFVNGRQPRSAIESMVRGAEPVNGLSLIGQNGPQFFRPTVPGYVIPADETEMILRRISGFGGSFAWGGSPPVGRGSLGGEEGLELFIPRTQGMRPPQEDEERASGPRRTVNATMNFSIAGPVDRRTEQQIQLAAARGLQRAVTRDA